MHVLIFIIMEENEIVCQRALKMSTYLPFLVIRINENCNE